MGLPNIGPLELIIILAVLLLVVGPRRLPEMGQAFGRTIREFRKASTEMTDVATIATDTKTVPPRPRPPSTSASPAPAPASGMLHRRRRPPPRRSRMRHRCSIGRGRTSAAGEPGSRSRHGHDRRRVTPGLTAP